MKALLTDLLICPACLPSEERLVLSILEKSGEEILSGSLQCQLCGTLYPIKDGIASLLPTPSAQNRSVQSKYERPPVVDSYLWSQYGDLFGDKDTSHAYRDWADLMESLPGFSLDAGCAAGRFTFEMGRRSEFAVGIDNSHTFIRTARELMKHRQLDVSIPEEGLLMELETIHLPDQWPTDKVEFIVGDAQSLPFRSSVFPSVASLNLLDKVPLPLQHLKEMNRVAKSHQAQFLFSDPFSWSSDIAREEEWLGGTTKGPYPGKGIDNIVRLLTGKKGELLPPWKIDKQGHVWWKIRNHCNHFELIRSCFIKASR